MNNMNPEQVFELFYRAITTDMNPPGMPKYKSLADEYWWRERFMNALNGVEEPKALRTWAEAPQMWLKGYRQALIGSS